MIRQRMSMFHGTRDDHIQCVIDSIYVREFLALGFQSNVDRLPDEKPAPKTAAKPRARRGNTED